MVPPISTGWPVNWHQQHALLTCTVYLGIHMPHLWHCQKDPASFQQLWMYFRSGTVGYCCIMVGQMLHVYSPGGSTFLREITLCLPPWKCDVKSKIQRRQSMHNDLKNIRAKFHPNPIWNDRALGFFWRHHPNKKKINNNKTSSDMRSVSDLKIQTRKTVDCRQVKQFILSDNDVTLERVRWLGYQGAQHHSWSYDLIN